MKYKQKVIITLQGKSISRINRISSKYFGAKISKKDNKNDEDYVSVSITKEKAEVVK